MSNRAMVIVLPKIGADAQKQMLFNRELRFQPYIASRTPVRANPPTYRKKNGRGLSSFRTRAETNPEARAMIIRTHHLDIFGL